MPPTEDALTRLAAISSGKIALFLAKFPEYRKVLSLALNHEEEFSENSHGYIGWQWYDVETHPTKLIRLLTEGIAKITSKTRQTTYYLLKDRDAVRRAIRKAGPNTGFHPPQ